jgi:hypothetical protein
MTPEQIRRQQMLMQEIEKGIRKTFRGGANLSGGDAL